MMDGKPWEELNKEIEKLSEEHARLKNKPKPFETERERERERVERRPISKRQR